MAISGLISAGLTFAQAVSCPASVPHSGEGWKATGGRAGDRAEHRLNGVSIANTEGANVYDLAPDEETRQGVKYVNTWKLKNYRDLNIRLSCRYRDTSLILSRDLPAKLETCVFVFDLDAKANVTGSPSLTCR